MLMQIDGTILFVIISFLIFLFIIKTILFRPFSKIMDERNKFYEKNSKIENDSNEKSKKLLEDKESKLQATKIEASSLLSKQKEIIKHQNELELNQTKLNSLKKIEENQNLLNSEIINAKKEIKKEMSSIVSKIVSKVLNEDRNITLDDNQIDKYLKI